VPFKEITGKDEREIFCERKWACLFAVEVRGVLFAPTNKEFTVFPGSNQVSPTTQYCISTNG